MPGYLFWFTLRKADGVDLGLQLCDTHAGALCIRHVWPYGAVHSWNKLCAGARPEVEIKASKQQNILKGNCEQKVDRNLVCRLDSAMTLSRPDPSAPKAIDELSKMVETRKTPDYKGGKRGGNGKPIPP